MMMFSLVAADPVDVARVIKEHLSDVEAIQVFRDVVYDEDGEAVTRVTFCISTIAMTFKGFEDAMFNTLKGLAKISSKPVIHWEIPNSKALFVMADATIRYLSPPKVSVLKELEALIGTLNPKSGSN